MDDPLKIPPAGPNEEAPVPDAGHRPEPVPEPSGEFVVGVAPEWIASYPAAPAGEEALRRRDMRHNLRLLLSISLAAFVLTAWVFVRVESPFGIFLTGPQQIVRAQLRALDRGDIRPAYDMFSAHYRQQVSFDMWNELIVTHRWMFHAEVLHAGKPTQTGSHATLEIHLRSADEVDYRARFTLIHVDGRWWIDDVHWMEEGRERDFVHS
jgi:hypothetical protein